MYIQENGLFGSKIFFQCRSPRGNLRENREKPSSGIPSGISGGFPLII